MKQPYRGTHFADTPTASSHDSHSPTRHRSPIKNTPTTQQTTTPGSVSRTRRGAVQRTRPRSKRWPVIMVIALVLLGTIGFVAIQQFGLMGDTPSGQQALPSVSHDQQTGNPQEGASAAGTDSSAGIIKLNGDSTVQLIAGEPYQDAGASATDAQGNDISDTLHVDIPVMNHKGSFTVSYQATGSQGTTISATRTVEVVNKPATADYAQHTSGLPILMYHDVYDDAQPPADLDNNMMEQSRLKEQIDYLLDHSYYFPSWQEVRDYVDGKIELPEKSVVMTFDDGDDGFRDFGVPLFEQSNAYATAFIITSADGPDWVNYAFRHISLQSHSHNMHRPGGHIGHGGIISALSVDQIVQDLKQSTDILGTHDAFAYPFGDITADAQEASKQAGFLVAVTTENKKAYPGDNPYALPRVRMVRSERLASFVARL